MKRYLPPLAAIVALAIAGAPGFAQRFGASPATEGRFGQPLPTASCSPSVAGIVSGADKCVLAGMGLSGGALVSTLADGESVTAPNIMTMSHTTSATAGVGFGGSLAYLAEASNGSLASQGAITARWTNATVATAASAIDVSPRLAGATSSPALTVAGSTLVPTIGVGTTTPAVPLVVATVSALTATPVDVARFGAASSGAAAAGFGPTISLWSESAGGTSRRAAEVSARWWSAVDGDEGSYLSLGTSIAGAIGTSALRVYSFGSGYMAASVLYPAANASLFVGAAGSDVNGAYLASGSIGMGVHGFPNGGGGYLLAIDGRHPVQWGYEGSRSLQLAPSAMTFAAAAGATADATIFGSAAANVITGGAASITALYDHRYLQPQWSSTAAGAKTVGQSATVRIDGPPKLATGSTTLALWNPFSLIVAEGATRFSGAVMQSSGPALAAASTLDLPEGGNVFEVSTGAGVVNLIQTCNRASGPGWLAGSQVTLVFSTTATVTHDATVGDAGACAVPMYLAGSANLSAVAHTTLTLVYAGGVWEEISRKVP